MTAPFGILLKSVRRVGPCAVNVAAPEGAIFSRQSSGAAIFSFNENSSEVQWGVRPCGVERPGRYLQDLNCCAGQLGPQLASAPAKKRLPFGKLLSAGMQYSQIIEGDSVPNILHRMKYTEISFYDRRDLSICESATCSTECRRITASLDISPRPVHCVGPCAVNVPAPGEVSFSRQSSGAAVFTSEGDLAVLPHSATEAAA